MPWFIIQVFHNRQSFFHFRLILNDEVLRKNFLKNTSILHVNQAAEAEKQQIYR